MCNYAMYENKKQEKYEQTNNIESIRINSIEKTNGVLTDRAGLLLFVKHLKKMSFWQKRNSSCKFSPVTVKRTSVDCAEHM